MATEREYQGIYDRIAALRETVVNRLGNDLREQPQLGEALVKQLDDLLINWEEADKQAPPPPDQGLAELVGIGPGAGRLMAVLVPEPIVGGWDQIGEGLDQLLESILH